MLASGDPFHYGVGATLARRIDAREMVVVPAPSAFSLAAARLGWSLPETALLSLHGRTLDLVRPHLQPGARILALTSDGEGPAALARLLADIGFGASRLTVLEALGGPRERIRATTAAAFDLGAVDALNTVAIEVEARPDARVIARTPGLADASVRARRPDHQARGPRGDVVVAGAAPRRAAVGHRRRLRLGGDRMDAGRSARCARSRSSGEPSAPRASAAMPPPSACRASRSWKARRRRRSPSSPPPDAIFIGGGAGDAGVLDAAIDALRPGGRLVVNAVTLETEAMLHRRATRRSAAS